MPNPYSLDLFLLIKSLTPVEKRYFKVWLQHQNIKKETGYLKLFEIINKQEVFDEHQLSKIGIKNELLPKIKERLINMILKSLRQYEGNLSVKNKLENDYKNAEILFNKLLYKEAVKMCLKIRLYSNINSIFFK